jgi:CDP-diacylglycerol--glycerol-3-phosphate 3-phosphatidyltransferase
LAIAGWRVSGSGAISGANLWGKLKTVSQIFAIALLLAPLDEIWKMPALIVFWISVALTLISGLIYVLPTNPDQNKV